MDSEKCLTPGCLNRKDQGEFEADFCYPCYYRMKEHKEAENFFTTGLAHEAQPLNMEEALYQKAIHQMDVERAVNDFTEIYNSLPPEYAMHYSGLADFVDKMLKKYVKYTYGLAAAKEMLGNSRKTD